MKYILLCQVSTTCFLCILGNLAVYLWINVPQCPHDYFQTSAMPDALCHDMRLINSLWLFLPVP